MKQEVFSFQALARIGAVSLVVFLAWKGLPMLVVLLIAVIVSMALAPVAEKLHKKRIPWIVSVLLVVLVLLIPLILVIVFTAFAFANQLPDVVSSLKDLISNAAFIPDSVKHFDIIGTLRNNVNYVVDSTKTIITVVGSVITVIVTVFYLVYDRKSLTKLLLDVVPPKRRHIVQELFTEISEVVGRYIRGNLIVSAICTTVVFIGLTILGVPFAVPLAIFTGIMDLLPMIGPLLALVPALILGLSVSPLTGILVLALYLIYQQIENTFIVPIMYNKALNLSPALVFLSVLIGGGLFGILGAFLALPVAASIPVLVKHVGKEW